MTPLGLLGSCHVNTISFGLAGIAWKLVGALGPVLVKKKENLI